MKKAIYFAFLTLIIAGSCKKDKEPDPSRPGSTAPNLGYIPDDDLSTIPASTNFHFGNGSLPAKADIVPLFPPIGDQGAYGTCVAWAVGYNLKTAIEGIDGGYDASKLSNPAYQISPLDLFTAIPDNQKGENCNGTNFSFAFDVMQQRGVATLQVAPYSQIGNCVSASVQSSWTSNAGGHKIKSYRKIDPSVNSIKEYISKNIPVAFGAKLADNFMSWNSDNVLSAHTTFTQVGQHAYHAMVIGGYDDAKGPGGAFRIINSWGNTWGDRGYIWVDYNFFINTFCTDGSTGVPLFVAENDNSGGNNPPDDNPSPNASGVDLAPWIVGDISTRNGTERLLGLNIYNIGNQTARASSEWSLYYIYYNAYDANDYGVITYDQFTSSIPANTYQNVTANNALFNVDIPAGMSLGQIVWNVDYIERTYFMPNISGYYYLVMIADAENRIPENNKMNNMFYTTTYPMLFNYGYANKGAESAGQFSFSNELKAGPQALKWNAFNTAVNKKMPNAYRPDEIISLIRAKKQSGDLDRKIDAYSRSNHEKGGFITPQQ